MAETATGVEEHVVTSWGKGQQLTFVSALGKYPAIKSAVDFSERGIALIRESLLTAFGPPTAGSPFVAACGSFARLEASSHSDLDYLILFPAAPPDSSFRERTVDVLKHVKVPDEAGEISFPQPNPKGVFRGDVLESDIWQIGTKDDHYDNLSRRLLLLLESRCLWNDQYFDEVRGRLVAEYGKAVALDPSKHFVALCNDLIRYFRTICVNYHAQMGSEYGKWPIRNVKLRHSRVLMYASLLFVIGELSKSSLMTGEQKLQALRDFVALPPLERMTRLYASNEDDNAFRLFGLYNTFLERLSTASTRQELINLEYDARYSSATFASLKTNSDAFASELHRFFACRKGKWSDRFFEYVVL